MQMHAETKNRTSKNTKIIANTCNESHNKVHYYFNATAIQNFTLANFTPAKFVMNLVDNKFTFSPPKKDIFLSGLQTLLGGFDRLTQFLRKN